ncbi:MAG: glycosyltransferase [Ilumatobacteraceae bacterium]
MTPEPDRRRKLSVIVPTLNESDNIQRVVERVTAMFAADLPEYDWELIITDNRSSDNTFEAVRLIAAENPRVTGYRFSRNFGYQRSILTGYLMSDGDAVIQLDADMQDPPEVIPRLVEPWERGVSVVYGIRRSRASEPFVLTGARKAFYRFVDWLSAEDLPRDAGDFRLVDRRVVELLRHNHDVDPYVRGWLAAFGFEQEGIEYERDDRSAGETKFRLRSLIKLAVDGVLNHSTRPLQLATLTSGFVMAVGLIAMLSYTVARVSFGETWPAGFVTLAMLQLLAITLNAAFLGIIGAYLGRLYNQSRAAPVVVIDTTTRQDCQSSVIVSTPRLHLETLDPKPDVERTSTTPRETPSSTPSADS